MIDVMLCGNKKQFNRTILMMDFIYSTIYNDYLSKYIVHIYKTVDLRGLPDSISEYFNVVFMKKLALTGVSATCGEQAFEPNVTAIRMDRVILQDLYLVLAHQFSLAKRG